MPLTTSSSSSASSSTLCASSATPLSSSPCLLSQWHLKGRKSYPIPLLVCQSSALKGVGVYHQLPRASFYFVPPLVSPPRHLRKSPLPIFIPYCHLVTCERPSTAVLNLRKA
ncbi:hypothetical protein B296_00002948 [Ensete ventricosum]|uniref:Uncharacterized protein n=1 Tax=Ensete ventricosum TaxID=4639 RepID=A0A427ABQ6_ENSVE|nr:hypothetical protein B296_00002948 [Ensete ventricosum]